MVEQKLDGARSGVIASLAGAKGALGSENDLEWSLAYDKLGPTTP
jgi:hypothetical protein